jgi:eukaryotic-like serine/threonine-protein kinase
MLAFISERDGPPQVWLKEIGGGNEIALTSGPDDAVRFSPDGSSVLYTHEEGAKTSLYRRSVVGGEPRKLVDEATEGDWSPDGREIGFVRFQRDSTKTSSSLRLAATDGGNERELARLDELMLVHPRFSPDGRWIGAVGRALQGGAADTIRLFSVDGKTSRTLTTKDSFFLSSIAWNANGEELLYSQVESMVANVSGLFGRVVLHRIGEGSVESLLTTPSTADVIDVVSRGTVAFDARSSRQNLREVVLGAVAGPGGRWLTRGSSIDRQPAYSPDGKWVVFSSNRSGNLDLWAISTESGTVRRVTDDAAEDWDPGFTPDGSKILWSSNRTGAFEIWAAETDGSGSRQVSHDGVDAENPTMTPDGWVVYTSGGPQGGIWKVRLDGTQPTRFLPGANMLTPDVSPDGRWVSYVETTTGARNILRVASVADGKSADFGIDVSVTTAATYTATGVYGRSRWRPDGKALYFLGRDESAVNGIFEQDFAPGKDTSSTRKRLAAFEPDLMTETFGVSPDGTRLAVASFDRIFSIMLAENVEGVTAPRAAR